MTAVLIISILLFLGYAVLIMYYRQSWLHMPNYKPQLSNGKPDTRISVIIPARNEQENIQACLDSVFAQSYPASLFEVIVVDDHSTDRTAEIVSGYSAPNLRLIRLRDHLEGSINSYKKKAIETAIGPSAAELIVSTDADCTMQANWLQTIALFYEQYQPVFIAAPVAIDCSNRFIEFFQGLDFMTLQGITGAAVHKRIHSMCNGANMAYTKKAFEEVGGFSGIDSIASGDDMLLMHKIDKLYPGQVLFLRSKEAIVLTQPVNSIGEFFNQRIRWASKAGKYQDKSMLPVLLLVYLLNVMLLVLPAMAVFNNIQYPIFNVQCTLLGVWVLLLILKTITELFFLYPVAKFFGKESMLLLFPLMQPFHILYIVIAGFLGSLGSYKWKGRQVK
jgi:cellulose synthase/poly-beta-1,6-N-acetylglucosamine synthase-like glycosyltransferase